MLFKEYKFLTLVFLLAMLLFVPYGLKLLSISLEPYPAIIFPAGSDKVVKNRDTYEFKSSKIYCLDPMTEEWICQDTSSFLSPIPRGYYKDIIKNEFGLNPNLENTVKFRKDIFSSFTYRNARALSEENINYTKAWLEDRLFQHGCKNRFILVRNTLMSVDLKTRAISEVKVIDEKIYKL